MNSNDMPVPYSQSPTAEHQRQAVKIKILGRIDSTVDNQEAQKKAEAKERIKDQTEESGAIAEKVKSEMLDRVSEMRHLRYEVIEDADIVQVSVINSKDGTIVRKVPPDKVVDFVKKFHEDAKTKLDVQA